MSNSFSRAQRYGLIIGGTSAGATVLLVALGLLGSYLERRKTNELEAKRFEEDQRRRQIEWQSVIVHRIIEENTRFGSKDYDRGMTFSDIMSHYVTMAQQSKDLEIGKDRLQDNELRRVLQDLLSNKLVEQTIEDRYILVRPEDFTMCRIGSHVINKLASNPGRWDAKELRMEIDASLREDVYNRVISGMISRGEIYTNEKAKLFYAATHPRTPIKPEEIQKLPGPDKPSGKKPDKKEPEC